jgi:predicted KAP-like P-loop ATPase
MGETLGFFSLFSRIIGNSLRWNPRLIKRFLNAYEIRVRLLEQSGINDSKSKFALLKLMLIEQKFIDQFKQLNTWVMSSSLLELCNFLYFH